MKKGAVFPDIFHPMGNTLFVSKRYYEFITHVNKENIFAVSGLTSPKARFYEDAFVAKDRKDALDIISSVADENLRGSLLVIEMDSPVEYDFHHRDIMPYEYALPKRLPLEMKNPYGLYTHIFPLVKNFNKGQFSKIDPLAYGFPQNWPLYMMKDLNNVSNLSIPDELLTIDSNNTGRVVMTDEVGIPSVLLSGTSKNTNPVFMVPRRSYGEMAYNEGYPPHIYTVVDGSVISTKPFNGQCLFDTFSREVNVVDQKIKNISFSPNRASFSIQNQKPGFFYYADGWSPYWKAYDNNKPVPVLKANYNFKAVFLPPGEHIVTFVYRPVHYLFVLGCYCLGLILGGTLTIVLFTREYINKVKFSSSVPS
ncbi:MAG: YfhO family protein [Candidatus Brocadia sp.]|nr:YfhO family protein [Candidatus Brocadia sp.]